MSASRNLRRSTRISTYLDENELNSTIEDEPEPTTTSKTPKKSSSTPSTTTSRSGRKLKPTKKIQEAANSKAVTKIRDKLIDLEISLSDDEDFDSENDEEAKAKELFHDDDVEGQNMYSFKTPKKRHGMALLASNTPKSSPAQPKTPKTPKTPTSSRKSLGKQSAKTPHHDRAKLKKSIAKKVVMEDSDDDFSASESDEFEPSSGSSSSDDDSDSPSENEEPPKKPPPKAPSASTGPVMFGARRSGRKTANSKNLEYVLESDAYFSTQSSKKVVTSNHTLDRLKNPRLSHDRLFGLLAEMRLSTEHESAIKRLHDEYFTFFPKWKLILNEGFSILLHGVGSKRDLLSEFHQRALADQTVIVINGFFPSLTIKDVLDAITGDVLESSITSPNFHEMVDEIEVEFRNRPDLHVFLIVHNIDGVMLRNNKAQHILSRLARIRQIHLLASIDHINAPLLWDNTKLNNYNFSWWDVTTMLPYSAETAFENSLLVQNSGALALSSMKNVFLSLTSNSRGIYLQIVKHQLQNKGNPNYQGMQFKDLYWGCREAFLVSSDMALRAQLTEFLDHKLVKMKRSIDGVEHLKIPIEHGLLQQFLDEQQ